LQPWQSVAFDVELIQQRIKSAFVDAVITNDAEDFTAVTIVGDRELEKRIELSGCDSHRTSNVIHYDNVE
jgi:hypothetical protein